MNPSELVSEFEAQLRLQAVSAGTLKHYRYCLKGLLHFLPPETNEVAQITAAQLRAYVASLQARHLADRTIERQVGALKTLFRFAVTEGYLERDPAARLPLPKVGRRLPRMLTPDQVRALLDIIRQGTSKSDKRNFVVFYLCYTCGLRISEAAALQREQLDLGEGMLRVIGKGDKERRIYLKPVTVQVLEDYLQENHIQDYLFPGADQGHITATALQIGFRKYAQAAGLSKQVTPHALRHSVAVHLLMGGAPISYVQEMLGHENLDTTGIYTQLTDAMTKEIVLRTPTAMDRLEKRAKRKKALKEERGAYTVEAIQWQVLLETAAGEGLNS